MFAAGENLLGLRLSEFRSGDQDPILVEKLEVRVRYERNLRCP